MDARTSTDDLRNKAPSAPRASRKVRSWWLKQLHTWHWISAAVSLIGMMLFAITGFTLNHAASIGASPKVTQGRRRFRLPLAQLKATPAKADASLPAAVAAHVASTAASSTRAASPRNGRTTRSMSPCRGRAVTHGSASTARAARFRPN